MAHLVNAEQVTLTYGTRSVLDGVSLGLDRGDVIGVVGRNGGGKTTLLDVLTGQRDPDSGRVTRSGSVSVGRLGQADDLPPGASVRDVIVAGQPDHVWAADAPSRDIVAHLLGPIDLDASVATLSGGERRRACLVAVLLGRHDLLVLDEPTNHLDVEAVDWLAGHLNARRARDVALLIVSHDRWFLDAVCTRVWEVHDGRVDGYDGGYAAYVLARAERARQAAGSEARRRNLLRKELAWLRRGPPARTSKPRFRIDAANALIEQEPPVRDSLALQQFAANRLGKDVFDLEHVWVEVGDAPPRTLLQDLSWSIGPGARIGLVGVNGAGKTTLLRLLVGDRTPDRGRIKRGRTVRIGHLSQSVVELPADERVLESVAGIRRNTALASGKEVSTTSLLEDFGFTGDRLVTRIGELSGGERRRLQFLRLLLEEPNVLLLDEPTNDLDIDTLTVIEDHLDSWPGTLLVVTHDRYFLERVCDVTYALLGDGRCVLLPGGVDQYLEHRRRSALDPPPATATVVDRDASAPSAAQLRQARKDMARIEGQLQRLEAQVVSIHDQMTRTAHDYDRLADLQRELTALEEQQEALESAWLEAAEIVG